MNYLKYSMDTGTDKQVKFQILYQSPKVADFFNFLARIGQTHYLTKTGYKIALGAFPEFKLSKNTIFLRGYLKSQDNKVDVTPFVNDGTYRKGQVEMFKAALDEFALEVEKADNAGLLDGYSVTSSYSAPRVTRRNKRNPMASLNVIGGRRPSIFDSFFNDFVEYDAPSSNLETWLCNKMPSAQVARPSYRSNVQVITL